MAPATLRALLTGLVDYAGLFPPAALPLEHVVRNYGAYRDSADSWALGALVVPAARLAELLDLVPAGGPAWPVSALVGDDIAADAACILAARSASRVSIGVAEVRAATPEGVLAAVRALERVPTVYVELPVLNDPAPLIRAVGNAGVRAKMRTGGTTADAFPSGAECARFIACCAQHDVRFKATAGLHHPLTGRYRLTYADASPRDVMFGFLNVFLAATLAQGGASARELEALLAETDVGQFQFHDHCISWRTKVVSLDDIEAGRESFAMSFGSCSFREPLDDLTHLGLL